MITAFGLGLLGFFAWQAAEAPDIAGSWAGEEWGQVLLKKTGDAEYSGTYSDTVGNGLGEVQLKWSGPDRRYYGTWREEKDRFGELTVRIVGDEIRGAYTTDAKSKVNPGRPRLADLSWRPDASKQPPGVPMTAKVQARALPKQLWATKEHVEQIQKLIEDAPVTTNYLAELFEHTPGTRGEYRMREDIVTIPVMRAEHSRLASVPLGKVHYLPASKGFYLQWDDLAASTLHYYGPFYGRPLEKLGLTSDPSNDKGAKDATLPSAK